MLRAAYYALDVLLSIIIVVVAAPILVFCRPLPSAEPSEMVVDPEIDHDDPGVDVDD